MSHYKTNDPAVLSAWEKDRADRAALQVKVDAFAARFGGKGLMYSEPARFAGIKFPLQMNRVLWTSPDQHGMQRPRAKPQPRTPQPIKDDIKKLRIEWSEHAPTESVNSDPIYKALGHHNSLCFIMGGITMFVHDGWLYAKTGGEKMPKLTEILGSEYEAAEMAMRRSKDEA